MDRQGALEIVAILKAVYPNTYRGYTDTETTLLINIWDEMFDEPNNVVFDAFKSVMSKKKDFAPTIADVREKILEKLLPEAFITEEEAWSKVKGCISNYHASDMFDTLPDILKSLVGSPNQLREWALMDLGQLNTVVKSNFIRSYKERARLEREELLVNANNKQIEGGAKCKNLT